MMRNTRSRLFMDNSSVLPDLKKTTGSGADLVACGHHKMRGGRRYEDLQIQD